MELLKIFLVALLITIIFVSFIVVVTTLSDYTRTELRSFNKIHDTNYKLDEWRIYRYELKKKYNKYKENKDD